MDRIALVCVLSTLASAASAAELGGHLVAELGTTANQADEWTATFSADARMPSRGVRAGLTIGDHLAVMGGWHRIRQGAQVTINTVHGEQQMIAAFFADDFTLGPKVGIPLFNEVVYPYVEVDGLLMRGVVKLDDDPDSTTNSGQIRETALSVGMLAMAGTELRANIETLGIGFTFHLELGHSRIAGATYGEMGDIVPGGGFALRSGLGVRF